MDNFSPILFDVLILVIIFVSIIVSVFRGFIRDLLSILVWIFAIALGVFGATNITPFLSEYISHIAWLDWAVGIIITIISLFVGSILNNYFIKSFKWGGPSTIDRSLGFLFGLVRGIFLVSLAYLSIQAFLAKESSPNWFKESKLKFLLQNGGDIIIYLMPAQIDKDLGKMGSLLQNSKSPRVFELLNLPNLKGQTNASTPGYTSGQRNKLDDKIRNLK